MKEVIEIVNLLKKESKRADRNFINGVDHLLNGVVLKWCRYP